MWHIIYTKRRKRNKTFFIFIILFCTLYHLYLFLYSSHFLESNRGWKFDNIGGKMLLSYLFWGFFAIIFILLFFFWVVSAVKSRLTNIEIAFLTIFIWYTKKRELIWIIKFFIWGKGIMYLQRIVEGSYFDLQ